MTAIVITASQDPSFIRPLATLRTRGIGAVVVLLDRRGVRARRADEAGTEAPAPARPGLRHALAEYELPTVQSSARTRPLAEALAR